MTGLSVYVTALAYRKVMGFTAFSLTLFLASRFIIAYDWKIEFIMLICTVFGVTLTLAYIIHFDNFGFISHCCIS